MGLVQDAVEAETGILSYGQKKLVYSGPTFKAMTIESDKIRLTFDNVGGGLASRDQDLNLVNAWGLSQGPATALWVANNGTDTSTIYNPATFAKAPLTVSVPLPAPPTITSCRRTAITGAGASGEMRSTRPHR